MSGDNVVFLRESDRSAEQMQDEIKAAFPKPDAMIVVVFQEGVMHLHVVGFKSELMALAGASLLKHAVAELP